MTLRIIFIILVMYSNCIAGTKPESYYTKLWCNSKGGQSEVILSDSTRVDCVTSENAVEFEFAAKWAESIGQSLHYGSLTGKVPGIVLIITSSNDIRFLQRLQVTIDYYKLPITVWLLDTALWGTDAWINAH